MSSRIQEIDGLRAIAMTMVIAQHCGLLPFGWIGVWLFYGISGFVITRGFLYEESFGRSASSRYIRFMSRRFFRIVPVYFLYLALNLYILVAINKEEYTHEFPYLLSFTYNWRMIFGQDPGVASWHPFGHLWTLSVEEQFYLFFPFIALGIPTRFRTPITILFIALGPIIRFVYTEAVIPLGHDNEWIAFSVYASSVCHFDAFLMGSLVARLEPRLRKNPEISNIAWGVALICCTIYVVCYVNINTANDAVGIDVLKNVISGILYGQGREVVLYVAINLFLSAVLIHAILQRRFSSVLSSRILALVGAVSYGGYLFHLLIMWGLSKYLIGSSKSELFIFDRIVFFVIVWSISVALAYLSFNRFERPITAWAKVRFEL
jgi:peptidoglycan/LPS O-acetylase OafA/YrhL